MAEQAANQAASGAAATPPAASGGNNGALTPETVQSLISSAVKPLEANVKILADTLAAEAARTAANAGGNATGNAAKPLTLDDLNTLLAQRDQRAQSSAQREAFIREKMKNVPEAYARQLGDDQAKWPAEEQAIRARFRADLAALGIKAADVGGGDAGGATSGDAARAGEAERISTRKQQLIASGMSEGLAAYAASLKMPQRASNGPA